jgi:hypothetical protein
MTLEQSKLMVDKLKPLMEERLSKLLNEQIMDFDIENAPFEKEDEVGIEINYPSLYLSMAVANNILYSLEIMIEDNKQKQGIGTGVKKTMIDICRETGISEYHSCGIHNHNILKICDKLGITDGDDKNRIIKL